MRFVQSGVVYSGSTINQPTIDMEINTMNDTICVDKEIILSIVIGLYGMCAYFFGLWAGRNSKKDE